MGKNLLKIRLGIIILTFWVLYFVISLFLAFDIIYFSFVLIFPFLLILHGPLSWLIIPGYILLYKGLSKRNRGIMLNLTGLIYTISILILSISLIDNPAIEWPDLIITYYIIAIIFYCLVFIIPGGYMISSSMPSSKTKYNHTKLSFYVGIVIMVFISTVIIIAVGGAIATSTNPELNFRDYFFQNFFYFWIWGIGLSFLLFCFGFILTKANISGTSLGYTGPIS